MSFRAARIHAAEREEKNKQATTRGGAPSSAPASAPPSTRLCVKNLPVHVKEDRLRKVFSEKGEVTDVKLLKTADGRSRKLAFIGYRTLSESTAALTFFNKTFLDTSRIEVEYALDPRAAKEAVRPWSKYSEGSSRHPDSLRAAEEAEAARAEADALKSKPSKGKSLSKSSLFGLGDDSQLSKLASDPKFLEYLHVMGSRSKNKFWSDNLAQLPIDGGKGGSMQTTAEEYAAVQSEKGFQTYEQYLAELKAKNKGAGGEDSDSDDEAFDQPMLDRDVDEVPTNMPKMPTSTAEQDKEEDEDEDEAEELTAAVNPLALDSGVSDLDYLKSKQKDEKDFDDDSDFDEETPAQQPQTTTTSKKRKQSDAEEKKGEQQEEEDVDAELKAEYEREQRAAEATATAAEQQQQSTEDVMDSGRLFLRNLSYTVSESDLRGLFSPFGTVSEVHVPVDELKKPKGFAYVQFMFPQHALAAQQELDGTFFLGRLLHILNARPKPVVKSEWEKLQELGDDAKNALTYKKKKELELKAHAASRKDQQSWNTLFIRSDTVTDSIAAKYGLSKSDILDTTASSADGPNMAVRLALAETQLINESKSFLKDHGVSLEVFDLPKDKTPRSSTAILVKNVPFNTELDEVRRLFAKFGTLGHVVMPPSKAFVLVEFIEEAEAKKAFKNLAYKKFKYVPLYLEWAPKGTFERGPTDSTASNPSTAGVVEGKKKAADLLDVNATSTASTSGKGTSSSVDDVADSATLYIKNLNFQTTEDSLKTLFSTIGPVRSVSISKKKNTKARPGTDDPTHLSMGYGFVEFRNKEDARKALQQLQGVQLDNHAIDIKISSRGATSKPSAASSSSAAAASNTVNTPAGGSAPSSKLLIKNLPFESTARDLRDLFSPFGTIQRIRLPKKFGQLGHRGFAFIDFVTKNEAKNAMDNVKHSHLLGRHLIIEYAQATVEQDSQDVEGLRQKTKQQYETAQLGAPPNKKRKGNAGDEIDEAFDAQFK